MFGFGERRRFRALIKARVLYSFGWFLIQWMVALGNEIQAHPVYARSYSIGSTSGRSDI